MKINASILTACSTALAISTRAAVVEFNDVNVSIPDGDEGGVVHSRTVSGVGITSLADVNVRLTFETDPGGSSSIFNGDLYVALSFDSGYSVLLSRSGRSTTSGIGSDGYDDAGFGDPCGCDTFTLDDQAANDVHTYRVQTGVLSGPLTGSWQPSARQDIGVNPGEEITSTMRDSTPVTGAFLSAFNGLNPNGTWTLFMIDMASGGEARLQSWALEFDVTPVPEPGEWTVLAGAGLAGFALWRRKSRA